MTALGALLIETSGAVRETLSRLLQKNELRPFATELTEVRAQVAKHRPAISVVGPLISGSYNLQEIVSRIRCEAEAIPILLLTDRGSEEMAIEALHAGVNGYLRYPCRAEDLAAELQRCLRKGVRVNQSGARAAAEMVGDSEPMQRIRAYLFRAALTDNNVLITGETGTGKELAAAYVHRSSSRRDRPLVTINCAAIPDSLLESELFGYERGAFTGALGVQEGKLKSANGGTIFLDEIGDMSPYAQAKILRVTENKEFQKLGSSATTPVNVRFVAATNQDLESLVREGKFRKDLFFRLNVGRAHLPPLRERREDIPALVTHYLRLSASHFGGKVRMLTDDAWSYLLNYGWPGNIRQLKNVLEMVSIQTVDEEITAQQLPAFLFEDCAELTGGLSEERKRLLSALSATNWNKSRAAEKLQWSRMTLYRKMAKHQVSRAFAGC